MKQYYFNEKESKWQAYDGKFLIGNYTTALEAHDALFKHIKTIKETQ